MESKAREGSPLVPRRAAHNGTREVDALTNNLAAVTRGNSTADGGGDGSHPDSVPVAGTGIPS